MQTQPSGPPCNLLQPGISVFRVIKRRVLFSQKEINKFSMLIVLTSFIPANPDSGDPGFQQREIT